MSDPLRIGFIHPDLGIGGAEKLIVDAAVSLQDRGHQVVLFTSRHDAERCFQETRDGTLQVHVLGNSIFPRAILNSFHIICAILRQLHLTFLLVNSLYSPFRIPYLAPLSLDAFDVFIVDQLSVCVPLLRWITGTRVVFYCHFPDKLLAGGKAVQVDSVGRKKMNPNDGPQSRPGVLKTLYRLPFDKLEESTTGESDVVLANSSFTARVYTRAFPTLKAMPKVVYPCIKLDSYRPLSKEEIESDLDVKRIQSEKRTFVSLNRFEAKKNIQLAVQAFSQLKAERGQTSHIRLIIAGGYDAALKDNIDTYTNLKNLCDTSGLRHVTIRPSEPDLNPSQTEIGNADVIFLLNFTDSQRASLLTASSSIALLYTPENEHFGIVPIEAMACGLPILGVNSGGPTETVVDTDDELLGTEATGLLRSPDIKQWAIAMKTLLDLSSERKLKVGEAGKRRVAKYFSSNILGEKLEQACQEAIGMGRVGWEDSLVLALGGMSIAFIFLTFTGLHLIPLDVYSTGGH